VKNSKEISRLKKEQIISSLISIFLLRRGMLIIGQVDILTVSLESNNLAKIHFRTSVEFFKVIDRHKSECRHFLAQQMKTRYVPSLYFINCE
jgi:hypothetical protein